MLLISFLSSLFFAMMSAKKAAARGRNQRVWFAIGFLFGLFGFLSLLLLPPAKREVAAEPYTPPEPTATPENWYYLDENQERHGPVSRLKLKELLEQKKIDQTTYVWSESFDDWKRVEDTTSLL